MIMRGESGRARAWHGALASGVAASALLLTLGAGLFSGAGATAEARMLEGFDEPQRTSVGRGTVVERRDGPAVQEVEQTPETMVFFEHTAGAPVAITEARMRQITREQLRRADDEGADSFGDEESPYFITLPAVTLANVSGKPVREVGVGFTTGGRMDVIAGYAASMKPGESQTIRSDWRRRNVIIPGTLGDVSLRVVWVTFADGTQWGARARDPHLPAPPPAPDAPDPGPRTDVSRSGEGGAVAGGRGSGVGAGGGGGIGSGSGGGRAAGGARDGGLNGRKLYAPNPAYPPIAKAAGAQGVVGVKVTVNEEGNVVAAEAVSGHPLLLQAAVAAAREAKFEPTVVDGKPVRVIGVITYNFVMK